MPGNARYGLRTLILAAVRRNATGAVLGVQPVYRRFETGG